MNGELYITLCYDKPQTDRENRNLENSVELPFWKRGSICLVVTIMGNTWV